MVFLICAVTCVIILLIRRKVVGGELGGGPTGRLFSCIALCSLWMVYIVASILQSGNIGGLGDYSYGISKIDPMLLDPKCRK